MNISRELIAVVRELIAVKRLDENDNLEREMKKAIKDGDVVEFEYTKKDGSKKKRQLTPSAFMKVKGRDAIKGIEVNDRRGFPKMFYLDMIGNADSESQAPKMKSEPKLSDKEKLQKLHDAIPNLKASWTTRLYGKDKNRMIAIYIAMSSGKALKYDIPLNEMVSTGGAYGAMETTHVEGYQIYIEINAGKPWDARRVRFYEKEIDYWTDDEGNRSTSEPSAYSYGGRSRGRSRGRRW